MLQGPDKTWRDAMAQGRFLLQRDPETGLCHFPPRLSEGAPPEWIETCGQGTVYSVTVVRKPDPEADYNIVLIDLDEGPRLMSRVDGIAADAVTIGMRVAMTVDEVDGCPAALFHPA